MSGLLGEFQCTMDPKGRVKVPTALIKQLDASDKGRFVLNRGFEKCLILYPWAEWKVLSDKLGKLNMFVQKNRDFVRFFMSGVSEITLDGNDRFLIPKSLQEYAGITKDVVLSAFQGKIEVWNKAAYEKAVDMNSDDFAGLAEEVMGNSNE